MGSEVEVELCSMSKGGVTTKNEGRLTKACTGARDGSFIKMANYPAPGDASR